MVERKDLEEVADIARNAIAMGENLGKMVTFWRTCFRVSMVANIVIGVLVFFK